MSFTVGTYLALIVVSLSVGYLLGTSSIPGARGPLPGKSHITNKDTGNEGEILGTNSDGNLDQPAQVKVGHDVMDECKLVSHSILGVILIMFSSTRVL